MRRTAAKRQPEPERDAVIHDRAKSHRRGSRRWGIGEAGRQSCIGAHPVQDPVRLTGPVRLFGAWPPPGGRRGRRRALARPIHRLVPAKNPERSARIALRLGKKRATQPEGGREPEPGRVRAGGGLGVMGQVRP